MSDKPLVSVVTPVYNGAAYLRECIESVLRQTYSNWEYIIVNNCSTDATRAIVEEYARKDSRIRLHNNDVFLAIIANHNKAFGLISPGSKYVKQVSADDWLFPECIERMVELGEANPSVGIIGSYQLQGDRVMWQGFEHPANVFSGRQICRRILLGGDKAFGFGSPTSILYRADLVRHSEEFFPNASPHADTSACFKNLQNSSFGFVYQVLSYDRIHTATETSRSKDLNRYSSAYLNDLILYGPSYLDKQEFAWLLNKNVQGYHRFLAINYLAGSRDKDFWNYHKTRLRELGYPFTLPALLKATGLAFLEAVLHPGWTFRKVWERFQRAPSRLEKERPFIAPEKPAENLHDSHLSAPPQKAQ
jgi:glycosyltransferase involved in cell wall biosynthesis